MINSQSKLERELTPLERAMLLEIYNRPGLTAHDHAEKCGHLQDVYGAIYHLVFAAHIDRDAETGALTVREI